MRKAENPLLPFFGHAPAMFHMPEDPPALSVPASRQTGVKIEKIRAAQTMDTLENEFARWLKTRDAKSILKQAEKPLRIFREQLHLMIRAYTRVANDLTAVHQQAKQVEDQIPQIRKRAQLRNFLAENFSKHLQMAEVTNMDLLDLSMQIMLEQKQQLEK